MTCLTPSRECFSADDVAVLAVPRIFSQRGRIIRWPLWLRVRRPKVAATIAYVPCDVWCTEGGRVGRARLGWETHIAFQVSLTLFSDAQETNRGFYFKESFDIAANPGQRNHEAQ